MKNLRPLLITATLGLTATTLVACASTTGNSAAPASSVDSTATTAAVVPECRDADLAVGGKSGGAAAGHIALLVTFADRSAHRCYLQGFPKASLVDPSGKVVLQAQDVLNGFMGAAVSNTNLTAPPHVVLDPGRTVMAVLEWGDVDPDQAVPGGCLVRNSEDVLVTAPGSAVASKLSSVAHVCEAFQINPVIDEAPK
jgi:hypothetical protein